jgi:hypothetical protein
VNLRFDYAPGLTTGPHIVANAKISQLLKHLVKALLLAVVNGRINVMAMKYLDCHNCLVSRVARIRSDMPRAIESCDLEAARPFLFWRDPLGDSTQLRVCPQAVWAAGHIIFG